MDLTLYQVDAFTDHVFGGNPAAVCVLDDWLPDDILQKIALENNLSETAFFIPENDRYHIRWFTPAIEVDLCGHATLAAAYVVLNILSPDQGRVVFNSRSGPLTIEKSKHGLTMDFPVWDYTPVPVDSRISQALGASPTELYSGSKWLAVFDDPETIKSLAPDMQKLMAFQDIHGIIATSGPSGDYDFISRYFAPRIGVPEDPVTGSAHCVLAPFWGERLQKTQLRAYQASRRGGALLCTLDGDRVKITGQAVLYMQGTIQI